MFCFSAYCYILIFKKKSFEKTFNTYFYHSDCRSDTKNLDKNTFMYWSGIFGFW